MNETKFVDGVFCSKRGDSPVFVLADLSFNVQEFSKFLYDNANEKGYVNATLKMSKNNKPYMALNTYTPPTQVTPPEGVQEEVPTQSIPF